MIGKEVYFIDAKGRCVKKGVVLQMILSQSGYVIFNVLSDGMMHNVERAIIFDTKKQAEEYLPTFLNVKDDMEILSKQMTESLDQMRETVLGKPEFKELADNVFKK